MMKNGLLLNCKNISKTFPGVKALKEVDFDLLNGEIHGLVGENGAGKSTLMKIISGVYNYDILSKKNIGKKCGIYLNGKQIILKNPKDAIDLKIMTIHQELNVIPHITVYENVFLNHANYKYFLNRNEMIKLTRSFINEFEVEMKPDEVVGNLPVDKQKLVEVLRAISRDVKVLIMDEPTSFLTDLETKHLLKAIINIAKKGIGVIFISHDLGEMVELCDRISVIRDGRLIGTINKSELDINTLVSMMIGRKLDTIKDKKTYKSCIEDKVMFEVKNLHFKNILKNINFKLKVGEVLGITGIVGSGGTELAKVLFSAEGYKMDRGNVFLEGCKIKIKSTKDAIKHGIALLTKDRKGEGLFLNFKIFENITLPSLKRFLNIIGFIKTKKQIKVSENYIKNLQIKASSSEVTVESLSGGNQQKVVLSKWLETRPKVFIMDEPTLGIDVAAKFEIRKLIRVITEQKRSIILISNEYPELESLCDRVLIMFKGEIIEELQKENIKKEVILKSAGGGSI